MAERIKLEYLGLFTVHEWYDCVYGSPATLTRLKNAKMSRYKKDAVLNEACVMYFEMAFLSLKSFSSNGEWLIKF